jgi:hypothetical protein
VIGRSLLASFGFGAQLRWEAPIGQWLGVAFQAAPSTPFPDDRANRKAGASFLPGVVGQAGLELGPRGSIVRFRPMVEGGVLGGFGLLRATASLSVNLGSR